MNNLKKICHICSYFETPIFSDMIDHQTKFSDLRVFYYQHKKHPFTNGEYEYVDKCPCYDYWNRFFFFIKQKKAVKYYTSIYNRKSFQLNFAHSLFTNGYVANCIKKEWNIPYIVAVQNTDLNVFFKYMLNLRQIGIQILLDAERVILASESYKQTLLEKYIPKKYRSEMEAKMQVVPYGINDFYQENKYTTRKNIGNPLRILVVGQVNDNKNQLLLCEAVERLIKDKKMEVQLEVIGRGTDKKILKKIQSYPFIQYYEHMDKDELIKHYRNADIFALLSKTETFGLVYAEALSQGLPIVYTKNQGFDTQFEEGYVGYHSELRIEGIIEQIKRIMKNYPLIQRNCVLASEKFDWCVIGDEYRKMYNSILNDTTDGVIL